MMGTRFIAVSQGALHAILRRHDEDEQEHIREWDLVRGKLYLSIVLRRSVARCSCRPRATDRLHDAYCVGGIWLKATVPRCWSARASDHGG